MLVGAACSKQPVASNQNNERGATNPDSVLSTNATAGNTNTPTMNANSETPVLKTAIVRLSRDGIFVPTVSVAPGTVVSFFNDDQVGHWIASDPHPEHSGLPGFDPQSTIRPGASFEFTFTRAGTFTYHDHADPLNAKFQGTVVVTP
jgi:plastocyanin